ncbi:MAG: PHD finger domain-containing protein [Aeromonas sp.]
MKILAVKDILLQKLLKHIKSLTPSINISKMIDDKVSHVCPVSTCRKNVENGIQCDRCLHWYHKLCSKLSKNNFDIHSKHPTLKWICTQCIALAEECSRILLSSIPPTSANVRENSTKKNDVEETVRASARSSDDTNRLIVKKQMKRTDEKTSSSHKKSEIVGVQKKGKVPNKRCPQYEEVGGNRPSKAGVTEALLERIKSLEQDVKALQGSLDSIAGNTLRLLIHNLPEPFMKDGKVRREAERGHLRDVLRIAGMPPNTPYAKFHRIGVWKGNLAKASRPMLVVFTTQMNRDKLLSKAAAVDAYTLGRVEITTSSELPKNNTQRCVPLQKQQIEKPILCLTPISKSTPTQLQAKKPSQSCNLRTQTVKKVLDSNKPSNSLVSKPALERSGDSGATWATIVASPPQTGTQIKRIRTHSCPNSTQGMSVRVERASISEELGNIVQEESKDFDMSKNGTSPRVLRPREKPI